MISGPAAVQVSVTVILSALPRDSPSLTALTGTQRARFRSADGFTAGRRSRPHRALDLGVRFSSSPCQGRSSRVYPAGQSQPAPWNLFPDRFNASQWLCTVFPSAVHLPFLIRDVALCYITDTIGPLAGNENRTRQEDVSSALRTQHEPKLVSSKISVL